MLKSYGWWWWGGVGGSCDFSVSPSPFGLDFGTLDFGTSDSGLTIEDVFSCFPIIEYLLAQQDFIFSISSLKTLMNYYSGRENSSVTLQLIAHFKTIIPEAV